MIYPPSCVLNLGNRIQKFSLGFFKKKDPGEIASVVLQDVANFEGIFGHSVGNLASAAFGTVVLSICFLFYLRLAFGTLPVDSFTFNLSVFGIGKLFCEQIG